MTTEIGARTVTTDADVAALLRRVQRLEEMETARNHFHRYAATLDSPTPESVAALFTENGALRTRLGDFVGRTAIAEFYRDRLTADPSEKRHFVVNPHTTWLEPGLVEIASYFIFTGRGDQRSVIGWGTYLDRIRVQGDSALFEHKTIVIDVGTDLAHGWHAE
jgi:hypothetical protein